MDNKLDEILIKLAVLEKRIENVEKKLSIENDTDSSLLSEALSQLLHTTQISTTYLQKVLSLSPHQAISIYEKLERMGLIKTIEINKDGPTQPYKVGVSRKYRVKKYLESTK